MAFDQVEVFHRKKKKIVESKLYSIKEIKQLDKEITQTIEKDLKNITSKKESIFFMVVVRCNIFSNYKERK